MSHYEEECVFHSKKLSEKKSVGLPCDLGSGHKEVGSRSGMGVVKE